MLSFFILEYWWIVLPGLVLGIYAQYKVSSTYREYLKLPVGSGLTGSQAARRILDEAGLHEVPVRETAGRLTDHYDPMKKTLYLSSDNFHGASAAALGVAAHEAGHALQDKAAYAPLQWRMMMVPATQFATTAYLPILLIGFVMGGLVMNTMLSVVIALFAVITLFQLITLPVEFDASRRAKQELARLGLTTAEESSGVQKVLRAAALTYVAAMITSALQLVQFLLLQEEG